MRKGFITVLFLILGMTSAGFAQTDYYTIGKQIAEKGEYKKALNIWLQARTQLDDPDPRIGFAFIELVTEQKLETFYEFASYMYGWGLSGQQVKPFSAAIDNEVDRLEPLIDNNTYRSWKNLVDNNDPSIYSKLNGYWSYRDATPATDYNERLVEHWQRIAYAREHFTRSRQDPYGTDERALVYVRYGNPDIKSSGRLQFSSSSAGNWIYNIISSGCTAPCPPGSDLVNSFVRLAQEFYTSPEYEVWIYRDLNEGSTQNTIFLFGTKGDTGGFGLINTVEEFIPNRAFSMGDNVLPTSRIFATANGRAPHIDNLRPGLILQMMYYNQLASTDIFFGKMLNRIETRAMDQGQPVAVSLGQEIQTEARFDLREAKLRSPRDVSVYEEQMIDIPIDIYQYRLQNEDGDPVLATFVESLPQNAFIYDYMSNYSSTSGDSTASATQVQQNLLSNYELVHSIQVFSRERDPVARATHNPPIAVNRNDKSSSILMVPHRGEDIRQVFAAELRNHDSNSSYRVDTPFPENVRGLGKAELEQPEPLEGTPSDLKMADLLLGFDKRNSESESGEDELFPFTPAHDKKVPVGEDLVVHIELYNISRDPGGIGELSLSYQLVPVNFLGWSKKQQQEFSLTLNLKTDEPFWRENLEIQTRALDPGSYKIILTAEDLQTGSELERELQFEVTGNS